MIEFSPAAPAPPVARNLRVDPTKLMLLPRFAAIDVVYALCFGIALRSVAVAFEALAAGAFVLPGLALFDGQLAPMAWLMWVIVPIAVPPFVEEWLFRGVLQPVAARGFLGAGLPGGAAVALAVVLVAAVFGAGHVLLSPGPWPLVTGIITFLVGATCGALTVLTGRLGTAIATHLVFNASGVGMLMLGTFG